ncbi:hypothetical protein CAF53_20500 [Sphingobium sp. LB126]|nr:hypothetical protein CAF53_20500 [Sphingobium sp. LB126]
MNFIPIVLITFKIVVLGTGMLFAIKWHYDQDKKTQKGEVLITVSKITAILLLSLLGLLFVTFTLARMLGLDLTLPR